MAKKKKSKKAKEDKINADDLGIKKPEPKKKTSAVKSKVKKSSTKSKKTSKKSTSVKKTSKKKKTTSKRDKNEFIQSETNVGLVGHVDHGKTTLVKALSGIWTERYADEVNRGITIKLGYAETEIMECPKCEMKITLNYANVMRKSKKDQKGLCPDCGAKLEFSRRLSFVDAPGHEILMATMLSGASLMDGALLLIAANESCPQPQTREHLAALEIAKIENIIIIQNKVDAVGKKRALEHFKEIENYVKGTIAENAPIIPVSAIFNANIDIIVKKMEEIIPTPELDEDSDFMFNVARSFDVNKPGSEIDDLTGGVVGGSIISGNVSLEDEVEIRPGYKNENGKYSPIITTVKSIYEGRNQLKHAHAGGLLALGTDLDPSLTRTDQLIGNIVGAPGTLPDIKYNAAIEAHLLDKVLGAEEDIAVQPLKKNELLMIVVGTMTSAGTITKIGKKNTVHLNLKRPICAMEGSIVAISRRIKNRFRLIGYGYLA
jgi:translation initiation factor 2 subunit 3